jgi:hypothetical protein
MVRFLMSWPGESAKNDERAEERQDVAAANAAKLRTDRSLVSARGRSLGSVRATVLAPGPRALIPGEEARSCP